MMRLPLLLLMLMLMLTTVCSVQAEVYRWKDVQGNVFFSDTPHEGAEIIKLGPTTVIPGEPVKNEEANAEATIAAQAPVSYESIAVLAPGGDETLRDQQSIAVDVALSPGLQVSLGHRLQLYMDGAALGPPSESAHFVLPATTRGTHQLAAAVLDQTGTELIRSTATVFHLHQTSVVDAKTGKPRPPTLPRPPQAK